MMAPSLVITPAYRDRIELALAEDIGSGDMTTLASVSSDITGTARLIAKAEGILCGQAVWDECFRLVDSSVMVEWKVLEGARVHPQTLCAEIRGSLRSILTTERTALNFVQRMSGIATLTRRFVDAVAHTPTKIIDTRKTTPLWRYFEKYAVSVGGGENHRMGLYDMFLIKDNHIAAAGSISRAIEAVLDYRTKMNCFFPIEVETKNLSEVAEALRYPVQRIMLDNMSVEEMTTAVRQINRKCETEASGGINLSNIREVAETGVDYISIGALTHSVTALDLSLLVEI